MIVLDTNVVSELMRPAPANEVVAWVDRQPTVDLWLTAITSAELLYGIARLPDGHRKSRLAEKAEAMIEDDFDRRILPFDQTAAVHYADIVARRELAGRPISTADAQIAAICRSHGAVVATRNQRDFDAVGIGAVDPWTVDQR